MDWGKGEGKEGRLLVENVEKIQANIVDEAKHMEVAQRLWLRELDERSESILVTQLI